MTRTIDVAAEIPEWVWCPGCQTATYGKKWVRNLRVCPECGRHDRLTAMQRLESLFDMATMRWLSTPAHTDAPLDFVDTKPYSERLAAARERTGLDEAVLTARGTITGQPVIAAAMEFGFLGGSLGGDVGEMITIAAEIALAERTPLLLVTASGGARMQEGALSLMQMARTSAALTQLAEAGVLTLSLITDPTFGGVAASFATLTDVITAEPAARLGFAGRRVIEQTIQQELPSDFQTAEFLSQRGFLDRIVPRHALREEIGRLLQVGTAARLRPPHAAPSPVIRDTGLLPERDPWEVVRISRALDRPTTLEYSALAFTGFQELHGDRVSGDCSAVVTGTAWLDDQPVVLIGQQKGHTAAELTDRNFGMSLPSGYRKAVRVMRLAAKLGMPVITLVDTPGAYPGAQAEEQGQAVAIAESIAVMLSLPVPVVSVVTGEGGSGGALALAAANRVLMCSGATYSVISPEGCAAILWHDAGAAPTAAKALGVDAPRLLALGVVDGVVPEPAGGAGNDPACASELLHAALAGELADLARLSPDELVHDRHRRFRRLGAGTLPATGRAGKGEEAM